MSGRFRSWLCRKLSELVVIGTSQGYWGHPSRGGGKIGKRGFLKKKLSTFFEIYLTTTPQKSFFFKFFGIFVNKHAIKRDFWDVVGSYISKN